MLNDNETSKNESYHFLFVMSILFLFILSITLKTHYIFDPKTLICRSGFIKKQIEYTKKNIVNYKNIYLITNENININGCTICN